MKKQKQNILLIIFLLLAIISPAYADKADPFVLVVDAGHGGIDPGAVGKKSKEKDINLAVATLVGDYIKEAHQDVKVVYTRNKDVFVKLRTRTKIANDAKANLFISIHSNASLNRSAYGAEVYILSLSKTAKNLAVTKRENEVALLEENYKENYRTYNPQSPEFSILYEYLQNSHRNESLDFASKTQQELTKTARRKENGVKEAGFWVLVGANMPCVLVEIDYITNTNTEEFIASKSGQEKIARSIANAFSIYKKENDAKKNNATSPNTKVVKEKEKENTPITISQDTTRHSSNEDKVKKDSKIVYKVQIFTTSSKLPEHSKKFKGYNVSFYIENNQYKYTYGESSDRNEISQIKKSISKDFKDAFIVKFENGVKAPK